LTIRFEQLKAVSPVLAAVALFFVLSSTAWAHPATGIVVDRSGNIYFSDLETIWKLDANGILTTFRNGVRGRHVHELFIDEQDNIYGADVSYNPSTKGWPSSVWKMTPAGKLTYLLETTEHPPRGMSIWRDRDGNNYFIDQNNHTKTQTLLLRRTPDGNVTTLAGSSYGHADGKGTAARFSSVGAMFIASDGNIYLSDGASVRRVSADGTVITLAKGLDFKTREDDQRLFAAYGSLAGLTVDSDGNVFVADAGKRRLLKIDPAGVVSVVLRTEPPYFPNGVAAAGRDLYVLEIGLTLPNIWSGPRVRTITPDGKSRNLTTVGGEAANRHGAALLRNAGVTAERTIVTLTEDGRLKYSIAWLSLVLLSIATVLWQRRRRQQA
jgi:sugar lactone lactonase YvrE